MNYVTQTIGVEKVTEVEDRVSNQLGPIHGQLHDVVKEVAAEFGSDEFSVDNTELQTALDKLSTAFRLVEEAWNPLTEHRLNEAVAEQEDAA